MHAQAANHRTNMREEDLSLQSLGERESWIFRKMARHGVFVPAQGERFYMDEQAAAEYLRRGRTRGLVLAGFLYSSFSCSGLSGFFVDERLDRYGNLAR